MTAWVPPHDLNAEASVLGAMLLSKDAIADVVEIIQGPDLFYRPTHGHIFDAITTLWSAGEPVDVVTVADELNRVGLLTELGGHATLLDLQNECPATSNAASYAQIMADKAQLRRLIGAANGIVDAAYAGPVDPARVVDDAEAAVFAVAEGRQVDTTSALADLVPANLDRIEAALEAGDDVSGRTTGFVDLDRLTCGLQPSTLVIISARPAMGKTAMALNIAAASAAVDDLPVLFFTLEMSQLELSQRILCADARLDSAKVKTGRLESKEWDRLSRSVGRCAEWPVYIDDNPNTSVMDIRAKARRLKSRHGLGMVIVDYVQLMAGRSNAESRQVAVSEISRGLKVLARELEVPVVALAQLNRGLEARSDKRPMLSDLRESGSLEQDADVVFGLFRDEVYDEASPDKGVAEVIVLKHRNGPTGTVRVAFMPQFTLFADMARRPSPSGPPPRDERFDERRDLGDF